MHTLRSSRRKDGGRFIRLMFLVSLDVRPIILRRSESGEGNSASVHRVQEHRALGGPSEDQWINASKSPDWAPHPAARCSVASRKNRWVNWIPETCRTRWAREPSSVWNINFDSAHRRRRGRSRDEIYSRSARRNWRWLSLFIINVIGRLVRSTGDRECIDKFSCS